MRERPPARRFFGFRATDMDLTVKLFATFRKGRFEVARVEKPDGATIGEVVDGLGIPREEVGILMVRGRHAQLGDRLAPGDTVSIFPLVGGG
jgi:molybdopterin synthase sulfur carrier subunit